MKKSVNWFMYKMFARKREIRSSTDLIIYVNWQVKSNIRNLVCILNAFGGNMRKVYYDLTVKILMLVV